MQADAIEIDAAAMMRLREGDDLALNELMTRWQQPLTNYLTRLCNNEATALDLAQETFVRIYESRARYDTRGKFAAWLYTIARNLACNEHRRQKRHPALSLDVSTEETGRTHLPDTSLTPDSSAVQTEQAIAVRVAVAELPEDQRTAILLSEFDDCSHADIATVLGCTPKAVEARLYRARQTLREKLTRWLK
jgi:RNA polymerase sigma-70 factor (ECF subfamily)